MASTSQKVPIPLPVSGVMRGENPRKVGAQGLIDSSNWVYRDGFFSVRPGLNTLGDTSTNLVAAADTATYEDVESVAWINDDLLYPVTGEANSLKYKIETDGDHPSTLYHHWRGWDTAENAAISTAMTSEAFPAPDPYKPSFLDRGGDGYARITATGSEVIVCTPMVPISTGNVSVQLKVWPLAPSGRPTYTLRLYFARYDTGSWDVVSGSDYRIEINSTSVEVAAVVSPPPYPDDPDPIEVTGSNDGTYTHAFAAFEVDGTLITEIGDLMFGYERDMTYTDPVETGVTQISETAMGITQYDQTTSNSITVLAGDVSLYEMEADFGWTAIEGAEWDVSPADPSSLPVFRVFDGQSVAGADDATRWLIVANGESAAIYWNGVDTVGTVADGITDIRARALAVNANRVLYCGTVEQPDAVFYTDDLTVTDFTLLPAEVRLADTPGAIVAAMEMGNLQTAIYKEDAIYMCIGQGGDIPFRFELRTAHVDGPASPLTVVPINDGVHVFLTSTGDIVMFDGVRPRSMGKHLQAYVQATMDSSRMNQAFGFYDKERKDMYFFYPPYGATQSYNSIVINMSDEFPTLWPFRFRTRIACGSRVLLNLSKTIDQLGLVPINELEGTIDSYGATRPELLLVGEAGLPKTFTGNDDDGLSIEARFETGLFDMGSITQWKTVKEIDHLFDAGPEQEITVDLMVSNFGNESKTDLKDTVELTAGSRKLSSHRTTGRLFSMAIRAFATQKIEWLGSEASVALRGLR